MHPTLDTTLRSLRQDLDTRLDPAAIERACHRADYQWRDRQLGPVPLVHWLLTQVLYGNTALQHISLLANRSFTASALAHARTSLPLAVLLDIQHGLVQATTPTAGTWHGHRLRLIDGSTFSMPDTPELQTHFGQPDGQAPGCGFPVAKILVTFDTPTGLLCDVHALPLATHEMAHVRAAHAALQPEDVLVGDRGFCSYAHLALLTRRGVHAVIRIHAQQIVDFTPGRPAAGRKDTGRPQSRWVKSLGPTDQIVTWRRPSQRPPWLTAEEFAALPKELTVRELRHQIRSAGSRTREVTLVTTLTALSVGMLYVMPPG